MRIEGISLAQAQAGAFDVIVIGAGLGGGILARRLTERGKSVLILEKGPTDRQTERNTTSPLVTHEGARLARGVWPKASESRLNGVATKFFGPYGSGVGGSSVFYAAALERPERHDLDDSSDLPHPTGGWPVGFDAFQPYFDQATDVMHLAGTVDPLSPEPAPKLQGPVRISDADTALMKEMESRGLHPYRLHLSVRYPDKCRLCVGTKCPWGCKMDGRSAGVAPALESGKASLLTDCDVREIIEDGSEVTGLRVIWNGQETVLHAPTYALCAGTLGSARLLLASNTHTPKGAANSSDWVGRGLMFHLNETFALWPRHRFDEDDAAGFGKTISLRDLYAKDGQRFGLIQSMGVDITYGNITSYLNQVFDQSILRRFTALKPYTRIPAAIAAKLFGKAAMFVGMIEDFPYAENRVVLNADDPDVLTFEYKFQPELLARRKAFRKALLKAFKGHKRFMMSVQPVLNMGHPLGTLRFGEDPATSVLRPDCRTHDLANLYVADGSFMPSALGVNPSLTIVANALRVGDIIAERRDTADVGV
jgi:choline dehydrogenase-like flavoprotein